MYRLSTLVVLFLANTQVAAQGDLTLTVTVEGVTPSQGQVFVSLFENEQFFLKKPMTRNSEPVKTGNSVAIRFEGLPAGEYAVSVFYDLDGDGELDTGMFRIPKEPVGFSNNARGKFGPAKWEQARFTMEDDTQITVNVVNATD